MEFQDVKPITQKSELGKLNYSGRRFKIGVHPTYDHHYSLNKNRSLILNQGTGIPNANSISLNTKQDYETMLWNYLGDNDGSGICNYTNGKSKISVKQWHKNAVTAIESEFENYCQSRVNLGHTRPTEMSKDMHQRYLTAIAEYDVVVTEILKLENTIAKFKNDDEEIRLNKMLQYGLGCTLSMKDGICNEIDGQRVTQMEDGLLVINEPKSPYHGMLLQDYRTFAVRIRNEKQAAINEISKKRDEEIKLTGKSGIRVPNSFGAIPKHKLPPWPEGVKNYLKT